MALDPKVYRVLVQNPYDPHDPKQAKKYEVIDVIYSYDSSNAANAPTIYDLAANIREKEEYVRYVIWDARLKLNWMLVANPIGGKWRYYRATSRADKEIYLRRRYQDLISRRVRLAILEHLSGFTESELERLRTDVEATMKEKYEERLRKLGVRNPVIEIPKIGSVRFL